MKHVRIIETHHTTNKAGAVYIRAVDLRTGKSLRVPYGYTDSFAEHHAAAAALAGKLAGKARRCVANSGNGGSGYLFVFNNFSAL